MFFGGHNLSNCVCVFNRYTGCVIWSNYEVVGFQPWSGINPALESVDYLYVIISCLLCYSSLRLSHHMGSYAHLGVAHIHPSIISYCTRSSTHSGITHLQPIIADLLLGCPLCYPHPLLRIPLAPSPPSHLPWSFIQGCPKMCSGRLLAPPCIHPTSSLIISLLSCSHLRTWPQIHPLCHLPLLSPYVGHLQLSFHHFSQ